MLQSQQPVLSAAEVQTLNQRFEGAPPEMILDWVWDRFGPRAAIGTSFQGAGLVILHLAKARGLAFPIFTIDTGLLFPETLALHQRLQEFLGVQIESVKPDLTLEEQADIHGPELWRRDPDLCCNLRKVWPLRERLLDLDCWITGLRRQQAQTRATAAAVELYVFDELSGRQIVKVNPLVAWTREAVWAYIRQHQIPYNPLYDRGYLSIGCWPCTRPTTDGEDERAGRWTGFKKVECGIHTFLPKKVDFQI